MYVREKEQLHLEGCLTLATHTFLILICIISVSMPQRHLIDKKCGKCMKDSFIQNATGPLRTVTFC